MSRIYDMLSCDLRSCDSVHLKAWWTEMFSVDGRIVQVTRKDYSVIRYDVMWTLQDETFVRVCDRLNQRYVADHRRRRSHYDNHRLVRINNVVVSVLYCCHLSWCLPPISVKKLSDSAEMKLRFLNVELIQSCIVTSQSYKFFNVQLFSKRIGGT